MLVAVVPPLTIKRHEKEIVAIKRIEHVLGIPDLLEDDSQLCSVDECSR
jgi:hypothetical protein